MFDVHATVVCIGDENVARSDFADTCNPVDNTTAMYFHSVRIIRFWHIEGLADPFGPGLRPDRAL